MFIIVSNFETLHISFGAYVRPYFCRYFGQYWLKLFIDTMYDFIYDVLVIHKIYVRRLMAVVTSLILNMQYWQ